MHELDASFEAERRLHSCLSKATNIEDMLANVSGGDGIDVEAEKAWWRAECEKKKLPLNKEAEVRVRSEAATSRMCV